MTDQFGPIPQAYDKEDEMETTSDLIRDPIVLGAIAAHGRTVRDLPWYIAGLQTCQQVDLCLKDEAPSLHIDDKRVLMRWFTPEQAVGYSLRLKDGRITRNVHVESTSMPMGVVLSSDGLALGQIVDIPGAWEMDILSAWNEEASGITDASFLIDVTPYAPRFAGDRDPVVLGLIARMGLRRATVAMHQEVRTTTGIAHLDRTRSYISIAAGVTYEILQDERTERRLHLDQVLPQTLLAAIVGKPVTDMVEASSLSAYTITEAGISDAGDTTVLTLSSSRGDAR